MAIFKYSAADEGGGVVQGVLEAKDREVAVGKLQSMGYVPIRLEAPEERRPLLGGKSALADLLWRLTARRHVVDFTRELASLLSASLPLDRSLSVLVELAEHPSFKSVLREVLDEVTGGSSLADALSRHPKLFSQFHVNMVRAGEASGAVAAVMDRLADYMESSEDLRDHVKSAMIYPAILIVVTGMSLVVLMTVVVPRIAGVFAKLQQGMPLSAQVIVGASRIVTGYWWLALGAVLIAVFGFRSYVGSEKGRLKWDRFKLKARYVGEVLRKVETARFAGIMATLLRSGVQILDAINIAQRTLTNRIVADSLVQVHDSVRGGGRLAGPLAATECFPALAVRMIALGEETGKLEDMMQRVSDQYEKETRRAIDRFLTVLEPAIVLVMGVVVGSVVITMLLAVFSVNEISF